MSMKVIKLVSTYYLMEIGLEKLSKSLSHTHLKLDNMFLNNLLKDASGDDKPHRNKKFIDLIGGSFNESKKSCITMFGWMRGYRTVPFIKLSLIIQNSDYSWRDVEKNLISIKAGIRAGEIYPNFPLPFDYKLGSIVGHILGDGSIDRVNHMVFFSNSDVNLIEEFYENIKLLFGINARMWVQERRKFHEKTKWLKKINNLKEIPNKHNVGLFAPKICSDILYSICGKFAEGKNKRITSEIKNAPLEFKRGLTRAFFDDEGSIEDKSHMVRFHQDNREILENLSRIINEFGIKTNPVRSYIKKNKLRHYFNITGYKEYSKFFDAFGCTSPKKRRKFNLLLSKVKNSRKNKNGKLTLT